MLLDGDAKSHDIYPVTFLSFESETELPTDIVGQPGRNEIGKGRIRYVFIIGGLTYVFNVSRSSIPAGLIDYTIRPNNELTLLHIPKGKGPELFSDYFGYSQPNK
jgi:hypothetical protein